MNTLAAFTSPLGSLHFAHPSATSALFQSAADRTTGAGSTRPFEAPRRVPQPQSQPPSPSSPTGRASRFGFKRRTSRTTEEATTTAAATRAPLEISSPVFVSSSNPMACTAFLKSRSEKEQEKVVDVPLSPVSFWSCATGTTTPLGEPERRAQVAVRVAQLDGRVSDELKRVGL